MDREIDVQSMGSETSYQCRSLGNGSLQSGIKTLSLLDPIRRRKTGATDLLLNKSMVIELKRNTATPFF